MLNSFSTPNFVMIGQETTKLEGGAIMPPHTVVFLK